MDNLMMLLPLLMSNKGIGNTDSMVEILMKQSNMSPITMMLLTNMFKKNTTENVKDKFESIMPMGKDVVELMKSLTETQ